MYYNDDRTEIARQVRAKVFDLIGDDIDLIISVDPVHVGYMSGYRSILLDGQRFYRTGVVVSRDKIILVTGASDAAAALETLQEPAHIYRYGTFHVFSTEPGKNYEAMPSSAPTFFEALSNALKSLASAGCSVAIDAVTEEDRRKLESVVGGSNVRDARSAILKARRTKLPGEIQKLRVASRITEDGLLKAAASACEGMTELEIAKIISAEIIGSGGIPRFIVVTAGARSALVDAYATPNKLRKGDLVRLDLGCSYNGYWADMARTWVVGQPTAEQAERYHALLEGEQSQIRHARVGVKAAHLYDVAMQGVLAAGTLPNYLRNHCGHGIGLVAHEAPDLSPENESVLEADMVLCVETPYYEMGWGGMMVEDTLVVTTGEPELLTRSDRTLRSI